MRTLKKTVIASLSLLLLAAGVAAAKPTSDEAQAAREHYKRGTTLYDLGKYDEAIIEFQQAYEIKDDPVLLYNIAQSYRLANKYQDALRFYRTYLRKSPKAPNRDEVETKIADMENLIAQQAKVASSPSVDAIPPRGDRPANIGATPQRIETHPAEARTTVVSNTPQPAETQVETRSATPTETPTETPPENRADTRAPTEGNGETPPAVAKTDTAATGADQPKPGRTLLIAGVIVAIVGVAALAAGIGLSAVAAKDSTTQSSNVTFDPALDSQGRSFGLVGPVLLGVGAAVAVAGVAVAIVGALKKPATEAPRVSFAPSLGRGLAGASLTLRF